MSMQSRSSIDSNSRRGSGKSHNGLSESKNSKQGEKRYYHVQIGKLADAFEKQFFSSIQQIEALEVSNNKMRSQSLGDMDPQGSGGKVFQNMTIHKQYLEYHELKNLLQQRLKNINRWSIVLNVTGVISLIYLIVSLFVDTKAVPLACEIGHAIAFSGEDVTTNYESWAVILTKLLGFMSTICFMVLGTYIVYYKALVKVDTMKQVQGMAFYSMFIFGIVGLGHAIFAILCAATVDYESDTLTDEEIDDMGNRDSLVSCVFELIMFSIQFFAFFWAWHLSKNALKTILEFHDYLISYRLTPRSRILRKHLPRMTMVIEEESICDQSSMMQSQSRMMSVSAKSLARRKFVFNVNANGEELPDQPDTGTDSSDDSMEMEGEEALERDLSSLDKEQADFIRKINRIGNLSFHSGPSANNSLRNTLTANRKKASGSQVTLS